MSAMDRIPVSVERVGNFAADVERLYKTITAKAEEYFVGRGTVNGYDVDDWLAAERELVIKPEYTLSTEDHKFVIEMALPGRQFGSLGIRVTPRDMLIFSQADHDNRRIFRIVRFPEMIDWARVAAEMAGNKLRVVAAIAQLTGNSSFSQFA
jgi:hypothetical protein